MEWVDVGLVGVIVTVLIAIIGALCKWSHWLGGHSKEHEGIDKRFGSNDTMLAEIRADVKVLLGRQAAVLESGSPLRLNDLGEQQGEPAAQ